MTISVLECEAVVVKTCKHLFDVRNGENAERALLPGFPATVQQAAAIGQAPQQAGKMGQSLEEICRDRSARFDFYREANPCGVSV